MAMKTTTYYTVSPLNADGTVDFKDTYRHADRAEAQRYADVFDSIDGKHGWTPVVEHTVHYQAGRNTHFGKMFSIAQYAQRGERAAIDEVSPAPNHHLRTYPIEHYVSLETVIAEVAADLAAS